MDKLTILDRGDCCAAQARYLLGKGSLRLMFCIHHFNKNSKALDKNGWMVLDLNLDDLQKGTEVKVG